MKKARSVTIEPKKREKDRNLRSIRRMINKMDLVGKDVVKQFISMLEKKKAKGFVKKNPELELAISNLPPKLMKMAMGEEGFIGESPYKGCKYCKNKPKKESQYCVYCQHNKSLNFRTLDNARLLESPKEAYGKCSIPEIYRNRVDANFQMNLNTIRRHKRNKSTKIGLNDDLKADLDSTGAARRRLIKRISKEHKSSITNKLAKNPNNAQELKRMVANLEPLDYEASYNDSLLRSEALKMKQRSSLSVMTGGKRKEPVLVLPKITRS
ncbi:unnamed protein product [Moneuplotes crassus]|uniref:Uncharacterized protein n=1 Tax=Euplotes crassus TaxID=5936 RepID=A0AAD1XY31_EUPCR|nr:unnamed protein product [Moneuplotes crassus]